MEKSLLAIVKTGTYKILREDKIIIEYYSGVITMKDVIHMKTRIGNEPEYDPTFNLLNDFRAARLSGSNNEMMDFLKFVKEFPIVYGQRKAAYLATQPNEVARISLFSKVIESLPIIPKTFSTIEAAIYWLGYNTKNVIKFESILDKLTDQDNNVFIK